MTKRILALILALVLLIGVSASAENIKVRVGTTPYPMYVIWKIADELGIDDEFGIDLELFPFTGTAQGAQACAGRGEVDITASCVAEHLTSIVGAPNLVNFSPLGFFKGFFYIGREKDMVPFDQLVAEKGLEAAKEERLNAFKGKAFCAIPQRKALILDTIAQVGLKESDITLLNFADDQKAAAAFLAGDGDFYIGSLPQQKALLKEEGFVNAGGSELLGPAGLWFDTMMTTEEFIKNNPDTCKKLLGVFYSAVYEFYKDPKAVAPIAAKYLTETSGSVYTEEDWLDMQCNYDFLVKLDEAKEGFFNPESGEYWRISVDYQLGLLASDGTLTGSESPEYYYGQSEQLFKDLLADQEFVAKIEAHK